MYRILGNDIHPRIEWQNAITVITLLILSYRWPYTILSIIPLLFCQSLLYFSTSHYLLFFQSLLYCRASHSYILLYQSLSQLNFCASHAYIIVPLILTLVCQDRNSKRWYKSNCHDNLSMTGTIE